MLRISADAFPPSYPISKSPSEGLSKLERHHNEVEVTISALQKMSISVPKEVVDKSEQILEVINLLLMLSTLERLERSELEGKVFEP